MSDIFSMTILKVKKGGVNVGKANSCRFCVCVFKKFIGVN